MTKQLRELILEKLVALCPFVDDCKRQCTPADQENCWGVHSNEIASLKTDDSVSFPVDIKHVQIIPFAKAMDEILTKNDYKGGWNECNVSYLRARLVEELGEYFARVAINIDYESTKPLDARDKELERKELADIANFCMMLWDRS